MGLRHRDVPECSRLLIVVDRVERLAQQLVRLPESVPGSVVLSVDVCAEPGVKLFGR